MSTEQMSTEQIGTEQMSEITETAPAADAVDSAPTGREGRGAADLDAVLQESPAAPARPLASVEDLEEALKDVVDPELGVNIVDLGLVYDLQLGADNVLTIDMTLTSAACPLTDMIEDQVAAALTGGPDGGLVADYRINWVWLPPWDHARITDDGREQLRALGFNV